MRSLLPLLLSLAACSGAGRLVKHGERAEQAGDVSAAYAAYRTAKLERPGHARAHAGTQRTGQQVLIQLEAAASSAFLAGDHDLGEQQWQVLHEFATRASVEGLVLRRDPLVEQRRLQARRTHVATLYARAVQAFEEDRFPPCRELLNEVLALDPGHADAPHLLRMAELEPRYRLARRAFEEGRWREAYSGLDAVLTEDPSYKDARLLRDAARTNASYTLALVPVEEQGVAARATYAARVNGVPAALATAIKEELLALRDPFLVLVAREQTDALLEEQQRSLDGIYDERTAARAGQLLGAKYVLMTKLLRYEEGIGRHLEMQVNLMDASTGRIHRSELVHMAKQDLGRGGSVRSLLIARAAERTAALLKGFDPEVH
ncbi:MAG: hypothetical protein IPM49_01825 [Flavobacteriales bacterium]|nr:hypothetical protein [Flavobacteriales bacterium]